MLQCEMKSVLGVGYALANQIAPWSSYISSGEILRLLYYSVSVSRTPLSEMLLSRSLGQALDVATSFPTVSLQSYRTE